MQSYKWVAIDRAVHNQLKVKCAELDRPISQVVTELIQQWCNGDSPGISHQVPSYRETVYDVSEDYEPA